MLHEVSLVSNSRYVKGTREFSGPTSRCQSPWEIASHTVLKTFRPTAEQAPNQSLYAL